LPSNSPSSYPGGATGFHSAQAWVKTVNREVFSTDNQPECTGTSAFGGVLAVDVQTNDTTCGKMPTPQRVVVMSGVVLERPSHQRASSFLIYGGLTIWEPLGRARAEIHVGQLGHSSTQENLHHCHKLFASTHKSVLVKDTKDACPKGRILLDLELVACVLAFVIHFAEGYWSLVKQLKTLDAGQLETAHYSNFRRWGWHRVIDELVQVASHSLALFNTAKRGIGNKIHTWEIQFLFFL